MSNQNSELEVPTTELQLQRVEPWQVTAEEMAVDEARERAVVPAQPAVATDALPARIIKPVLDVGAYLAERKPCVHFSLFDEEVALFVTLPSPVKDELKALLGQLNGSDCAFGKVLELLKTMSLHQACKRVVRIYSTWNWSPERFRARFDLWQSKKDWTALVNKSKAGIAWQTFKPGTKRGLSELFLKFVEARVGDFKRSEDGMRQAFFSIYRQWKTGLNHRDELEPIPGYGYWRDWFACNFPDDPEPAEAPIPPGWGYDNLRTILRKRMPKAVRKLLHEGTAAAKPFLPSVLRTRAHMRFMEEVTFDDLRLDYRVIDPDTGEVCDMWILLARCTASGIALGFVQRPAKAREDGSQEHLKLQDMKQLAGLILETYGLPPYLMTWKLERGTATLSEGSCAALAEFLPGRIAFSFNSMVGGKSGAGYREKQKGNSNGKTSHESLNRLVHTMSAGQPGQTGLAYGRRPTDLKAREEEAVKIFQAGQLLPADLRGQLKYPILTIEESRKHLFKVFRLMNARTEHAMEGFDEIVVWFDSETGNWRPRSELPAVLPEGIRFDKRMESPYERAAKLIQATIAEGLEFERVSPDIITSFYKHSQYHVSVSPSGEIKIKREGKLITYKPAAVTSVASGDELLAHFNNEDPEHLYCTNSKGAIVGIWVRRERHSNNQEQLAAQLSYTQTALHQARSHAEELSAQERSRLDAMREHNNQLLNSASFVQIAEPQPMRKQVSSGAASALAQATTVKQQTKTSNAKQERDARARRRAALDQL